MLSLDTLMFILESAATVVGVLVVLCLIFEKYWAWPLGVVFCFLTAPVFWHSSAYGYLTLTLIGFLPLNLYGWYFWLFGAEQKDDVRVSKVPLWALLVGFAFCLLGIWLLPHLFSLLVANYYEEAQYIYLDNSILVVSLVAMWFQARKWIETWVLWFVINIGTVILYALLDLTMLMVLYVLYLGMAVWGYLQWRKSMTDSSLNPV